jgi:hypothetical protein
MRKSSIKIIAILLLLLPLFTLAQTTITGRVVNSRDGAPVANASVLNKCLQG